MLQGPPGPFWSRLADGLEAEGHRVAHVRLNLGDRVFWRRGGATDYRGSLAAWPGWLAGHLRRTGATDILYYADRLPYHVAARAVARAAGLRTHAVEFGYLRPDWITLEPEGMGRASRFPRDPDAIRALAEGHPDPDMAPRYGHAFLAEAWREVTYSLCMVFGRPLYPRYRSDRYYWPLAEYLAWLVRLAFRRAREARGEAVVDRILAGAVPYNLVALQLQMDYQIRAATDFPHLEVMLDRVMASLAAHAPPDRQLVIKTHPLDAGLEFWGLRVRRLVRRHGLAGRVHLVDSRRLAPLLRASRGVIVANSTVGLHALFDGVPVLALGHAIYDVPGLTHRSGLDRFWTAPEPVDATLARDLRRALAAHVQVRGDFYHPEGIRAAVAGIVARLSA